jgi:dipeptidyl-peptidase-4
VRHARDDISYAVAMRPVFQLASAIAIGCALSAGVSAQAQRRLLTIDAIYDPDRRVDFSGTPATNLRWVDADTYLERRRTSGGAEWLKVNAATGSTTPLYDVGRMTAALAAVPGISKDAAADAARGNDLTFNNQLTAALVAINDDLYVYTFGGSATRLTAGQGTEEEATFSPDARRVAFVRANNLYTVDVASPGERALTSDGSREVLNGKLDWLYQEEIYGRGRFRGYWWSPDSSRLAYLQLDERPVPEYTVVDDISYRPIVEVTDYPKAGDANPKVRLGNVSVSGGNTVWTQLESYGSVDLLVVDVDWTPDSRRVAFQIQDREQTWLDLNLADATSGRVSRVLRETTKAWVNVNGSPSWLKDGSFLWFSERDGFKHLYHYRTDGTQVRRVTSGRWDVRRLNGIDEQRGVVYFEAGARRHIDTDLYRVGLDGSAMTRLSRTEGTHRATFNPTHTQYIGVWNDAVTPTQVRLHRADGTETRVLDANPVGTHAEFALAKPEFLEVRTRDGFVMDAMMIKPPDFDPSRRYPVYQYTYAGPGTSLVRNQWAGTTYMYHQLLAQQGIIVWVLDNRSAGGKGAESQWPVYQRLGEVELQDLEDGVGWLKQQPYVDSSRLVLHGWSYGGFMTAYALTHSTSWSAGIVGAPVSDWRNYDTVYTERFMKTPQNNPDGYRRTAPRFAAARLHGRMLLIHGSIDDNVHRQNSEQFAYELQRAGKPFEMMVYPKSRHAITDARLNKHLRQVMFDFITRAVR